MEKGAPDSWRTPLLRWLEKPDTDTIGNPKGSNVVSLPVIFGRASEEPRCGRFIPLADNRFRSGAVRGRATKARKGFTRKEEGRHWGLFNVIIDRIDIKGNDRPGST